MLPRYAACLFYLIFLFLVIKFCWVHLQSTPPRKNVSKIQKTEIEVVFCSFVFCREIFLFSSFLFLFRVRTDLASAQCKSYEFEVPTVESGSSVNIHPTEEKSTKWANYILGTVNEFVKVHSLQSGFDCCVVSSVPAGKVFKQSVL